MLPHPNAEESLPPSTRKVYINPNFHSQQMARAAFSLQGHITHSHQFQNHIPPTMPALSQPPAIHVNPNFLQRQHAMFEHYQLQQMQLQQVAVAMPYYPPIAAEPTPEVVVVAAPPPPPPPVPVSPQAKIISKASTCLVRKVAAKSKAVPVPVPSKSAPQAPLITISKRKIVRQCVVKPAPAPAAAPAPARVAAVSASIVSTPTKRTKYKLVRAISLTVTPLVKKRRSLREFVGQYALRRTNETGAVKKLSSKPLVVKRSINKSLSMVSLHGVMFKKTAKNKLTKLDAPHSTTTMRKSPAPTIARTVKQSIAGRTLFVSGNKFVLDSTGCRLTRVQTASTSTLPMLSSSKMARRRIDVGGLTYIASSKAQNVFIRTTNHLSRAHLMSARQRSLHMLNGSLVKTNVPCAIFQRLGKCAAHSRGKCRKLHDKRQVAICPRFLHGDCTKTDCLLSHNVSLEKMPVCRFYLRGVCVREDCPYLHKKLGRKAEVCIDFLRGYCPLAAECNKRHEFICPEVERNGKCEVASCPICKQKPKALTKTKSEPMAIKAKNKTVKVSEDATNSSEAPNSSRYFKREDDQTVIDPTLEHVDAADEIDNDVLDEETSEDVDAHADAAAEDDASADATHVSGPHRRPKLGMLPAFIPLGNEE